MEDRFEALLGRLGVEAPAAVAADLREGWKDRRGRDGGLRHVLWMVRQVSLIVLFEMADRLRPSTIWSSSPWVALDNAFQSLKTDVSTVMMGAGILAVGFGAAATIYGSYQGFSRAIPVPGGEEIVQVRFFDARSEALQLSISHVAAVAPFAASPRGLGAFQTQTLTVAGPEGLVTSVSAAAMSVESFRILQVAPTVGRLPAHEDRDVALLSHEQWEAWSLPGRSPLGRTIRVNGVPHTVIGTMPPGFGFPFSQDFWTVLGPDAVGAVEVFGRLGEGGSRTQVEAELMGRISAMLPGLERVDVLGFTEKRGEGDEAVAMLSVLALVLVLLLVSCSNVANLLLIRSVDRSRTLAVHQALGAAPRQIFLQVLFESLLISFAGALAGLGLAWGTLILIEANLSDYWGYFWMRVELQSDVAWFLLGLACITGLVAGMGPALQSFKADVAPRLREGGSGGGGPTGLMSPVLLGGQVAFSFIALLTAVMMGRGLFENRTVSPDFPADQVQVGRLMLPQGRYQDWEAVGDFRVTLVSRVEGRAGLDQGAVATGMPGFRTSFWRVTDGVTDRKASNRVATVGASPGYFSVFGLDLLQGRLLRGTDDTSDAPPVVVVSRAFADVYLAADASAGGALTGDVIGQRITMSLPDERSVEMEVVGVVEDLVIFPADARSLRPRIYVPLRLDRSRDFFVYMRSAEGESRSVSNSSGQGMVSLIQEIDPGLAVMGVMADREPARVLDLLNYIRKLYAVSGLLGLVGAIAAVVVAALGLIGILGYEMRGRRRELGLRMALGAGRQRILGFVVARGLRRVLPGLVVGAVLAATGLQLLGTFFGGGTGRVAVALEVSVVGFLCVAVLASLIPARRAIRVDPRITLQEG